MVGYDAQFRKTTFAILGNGIEEHKVDTGIPVSDGIWRYSTRKAMDSK